MKYKLSVYQRMQQKLALTPMMRQSLQLLNMSTKDLNEFIDSILEKNPFLQKQFTKRLDSRDYAIRNSSDIMPNTRENALMGEEDPRAGLIAQLRLMDLDKKILEIAEYLIYEMDDNGYIKVDNEEAAADLSVTPELVEKVIAIIQSMEPAGIGARDPRECLLLQLERRHKKDSLEYMIVRDFIADLARNDVKKIAHDLAKDEKEVSEAIKRIKGLNPKPASTILAKREDPVIPDLTARIVKNEVYLELNREWVPQLRLYNPYENKLEVIKDPEAKEFLRNNMNSAKGIIDSLKRREEVMCKVADYILRHQKETLNEDISNIKSLTISEVAEALKLHASTISRTIANKFIQINDNVIPLKSLLSHAIKKENGEITSKTSVKSRIRGFIETEDKGKPLSDNSLKGLLDREGINIKRRTVAKYRESLRILPTHLRKKR
ncbi:MAG: RNA polymerase factor sigma-54 [Candidatus Omnitrophota bacterium]